MKSVPLLDVAPLASDRIKPFEGERPYLATGSVGDGGELFPETVTYLEKPSRADLAISDGDVCFARMQGTKKVVQFDGRHTDLILSTGFGVLRPEKDALDPGYLRHWLNSPIAQATKDKLCSGATQKAITNEKIADLVIPLPDSISEQRRIARVLDKIEELRVKRREASAKLDQLLQSIFLDMFGDPVLNPKAWPTASLGEILDFTTGKLDSNAAEEDGQYPFFTCARTPSRIGTFAFDCEALLLAGNNAAGQYWVKHYMGRFNAYQRTYVLRIKNKLSEYAYMKEVIQSRLMDLQDMSKGSNTKYLTLGILKPITVPMPPADVQRKYSQVSLKFAELRDEMERTSNRFEQLCSVAQEHAFCGKL